MRMPFAWMVVAVAGIASAGCGGSDGTSSDTDASTDASTDDDTGAPTDAGPDALDLCPGQLTFTGDYIDWDSTDDMFAGVPFAAVAPVDRPGDAVMTAPNGRSVLCIDPDLEVDVLFTQGDYLDLVFSALPSAVPYTVRGLAEGDVGTAFEAPLPSFDELTAQLLVDARFEDGRPAPAPTIGAENEGVFSRAGAGPFSAGDTGTGSYLFANVAIGDGETVLTVPNGCRARETVTLRAGALAYVRVFCE